MEKPDERGKNRGGRPSKFFGAPRVMHSFRMRETTRARIEAAALQHQCSLSEEVETRLDQSLVREDRLGGSRLESIADAVATTLLLCEQKAGRPWYADDFAARYAYERVIRMLAHLMGVETLSRSSAEPGKLSLEEALAEASRILAELDEEEYKAQSTGLAGSMYRSLRSDPLGARFMGHRLERLPLPPKSDVTSATEITVETPAPTPAGVERSAATSPSSKKLSDKTIQKRVGRGKSA